MVRDSATHTGTPLKKRRELLVEGGKQYVRTWGTNAVIHPIEVIIAFLADSNPGKVFLDQVAHTIMEIQKNPRATAEMIFVKNHTSFCTVVSLNLVSPDMVTIRPMIVLSPVAKTTPVHFPCTTMVELRARLRVSIALSEVDLTVPGII